MKVVFHRVLITFPIILFILSPGCGGGTTGTGGTGSDFVGRVLTETGGPVSDATITIAETGDSTNSDPAGDFNLQSNVEGTEATLLVETPKSHGEAKVDGLPGVPATVEISLQ